MKQTADQESSRKLDQFYTNPVYASSFLEKFDKLVGLDSADVLLEPSAGSGSFYNLLDPAKRQGLDLDPKCNGISQMNFFDWCPPVDSVIYTIGNPPFGKNASLAVKFFNHSAVFSDAIAFVLPKTFRKASIVNRLHRGFHKIYDEDVPKNSFIFNQKEYDVWCCGQIWVKKHESRSLIPILSLDIVNKWFEVVSCYKNADFAVQRVGGGAGTIKTDNLSKYSSQSHYMIKQHDRRVLDVFKKIDFNGVKFNTAGNPSVSASEMVDLWINSAKKFNIYVEVTRNLHNPFNEFFDNS